MGTSKAHTPPTEAPHEIETLDPDSLSKRQSSPEPLHLNLRVTGDDAIIFEHLKSRTPNITDSLRVRDSVRTAVYLLAMRDKGSPVFVKNAEGKDVEVLEYLGVYYPEQPSKARAIRKK
ncbi:hypothetical protein WNB94_08990 [Aquabacterium sp. A3]|uniref:hypothetical protein n=1 Tax=Aquabacterium sp. A3 TaxID=3132829 RepID=UPI00311A51D0